MKASLLDEDISKEFLGSWNSLGVTGEAMMDFNFEPVTKGKMKGFDFGKLKFDSAVEQILYEQIGGRTVEVSIPEVPRDRKRRVTEPTIRISSISSTQSRAVTDLKEQIEIQTRLLEETNRRAEANQAAHAKELEETKKQMKTKLEGNLREMEELKRMVWEMMVNLTPSMSCNLFTGSETQPPSQH